MASTAFVGTLHGSPTVTANGKSLLVKPGVILPNNAILRTGGADSIEIYFDEATRIISLQHDSTMRIDLLTCSVTLDRGEAFVRVRKSTMAANLATIKIRTSAGITSVAQGDFSVNALQQEVSALTGEANYQSLARPNELLPIKAGQALSLDPSNAPKVTAITPKASVELLGRIDRGINVSDPVIQAAMSGGKLPPPISP